MFFHYFHRITLIFYKFCYILYFRLHCFDLEYLGCFVDENTDGSPMNFSIMNHSKFNTEKTLNAKAIIQRYFVDEFTLIRQ